MRNRSKTWSLGFVVVEPEQVQAFLEATNITSELWDAAKSLFTQKIAAKHPPLRLLGFGVHGIGSALEARQQELFGEDTRERQRKLDQITDEIAAKFGKQALHRGRHPNSPQ